uniref:Uncharacterized protein n=1 Tax=Enterococcus faecalis TaxID=1351 RepID=Q9F1F4_ENTFL|nr:hypothetical protein [Enterococcus faecalis]
MRKETGDEKATGTMCCEERPREKRKKHIEERNS